jgi:O-antigen/teichoic acid export membrane protein
MLWRHSALYLLARGLPGLISLLAIAVYTRLLGADEYGRYALVIAGVGFANKLVFEWLRLALLRFLPAYEDRGQVFSATIAAGFLALVAGTAALGGIALVLATSDLARRLLLAGMALLCIQVMFDLELERVRIHLLPRRYGMLALGRAVLSLMLGALFVWLGFGAIGVIAGLCLGMLITLARPLADSCRQTRLELCDWALLARLSRYGAPLAVTAALGFAIASLDRFLIGWSLGEGKVGLYAAGYDLANFSLGVLLMIVNLAAYPLVVRALEEHGAEVARHQLVANLTALLAIGFPAAIGFAVLAQQITNVVLGQEFRQEAARLMPLIAAAALLRDVKAYYLDLAFHLGRNTIGQMWVTVAAVAVNAGLNVWWIPAFGVVGAAYAAVVAYAMAVVLSGLVGRRVFRLPGPNVDTFKVSLASCGMGLVLWQVHELTCPAALVGQVLGGAVIYGLLVILLNVAGLRARIFAGLSGMSLSKQGK